MKDVQKNLDEMIKSARERMNQAWNEFIIGGDSGQKVIAIDGYKTLMELQRIEKLLKDNEIQRETTERISRDLEAEKEVDRLNIRRLEKIEELTAVPLYQHTCVRCGNSFSTSRKYDTICLNCEKDHRDASESVQEAFNHHDDAVDLTVTSELKTRFQREQKADEDRKMSEYGGDLSGR